LFITNALHIYQNSFCLNIRREEEEEEEEEKEYDFPQGKEFPRRRRRVSNGVIFIFLYL